jgi:hypothetical protein
LATKGKTSRQEDVYEKLMQQIINRKYRQIPNDRTLSNQLLDIARNESVQETIRVKLRNEAKDLSRKEDCVNLEFLLIIK